MDRRFESNVVGGRHDASGNGSVLATWVTRWEPEFIPDHVDGRYLFDVASRKYQQSLAAQDSNGEGPREATPSLGDIVMVALVREARERGLLHTLRPFLRFTERGVMWDENMEEAIDALIRCTGLKSALDRLAPLGVIEPDGHKRVEGTRSVREPMLWLVGYGDWTGYSSATLIDVGRTAHTTLEQGESWHCRGGGRHVLPP